MPKPKRTKRVIEYVNEEEEREEALPISDPAEESYAAFIGKWGREGAKVRVYRNTPQGRQYCMLGKPEEIDPEFIRMYHAKQTFAHETGAYEIEVEVNGEVRPPFHIMIAPQVNAPGIPESQQSGPMGEMFRMLQAQNERLERQISQMHNVEREPLGSLADALVKIDQMRNGGQSKEIPIDTLMKAIELGRTLGGSEPDMTVKILDVLKDSMPAITGLIGSVTKRVAGNQQAEVEQMPDENAMLKQGLNYMKRKALAGSDPGLYIDIVIDNRDEPLYGQLIRRILESDFSAFAAIDPDIARPEYEPFFRAIYDGVRSVFIQPHPVESAAGGENGNGGNIEKDGRTRKGSGGKS